MHRQIIAIAATAQAIIDGDIAVRMPVRGTTDELDRLAATLNRMLDRIGTLMESLRQVSTDVAHDLRTPLTRLRNQLESLTRENDGRASRESIDAAIAEVDAILGTFAAVLRISQIESGARRAGFRRVDLTKIAANVVEAFRPSAEENHQTLTLTADQPAVFDGDSEMITQMIANLVENAIMHAGPGTVVRVLCGKVAGTIQLAVIDNGPGVPVAERERLFDRFHRLESSRSTPGNGLGLALVAAVARLHGADASLHDAEPGLEARIVFKPNS
jgi:signal transduction histidine kinase